MDDLGARLKHAREKKGVSLREIATRTKISVVALEALERNDMTRLPGGIFGRAFVRAYAQEIGLDPDETVAAFQVDLERSEREAAERGATRVEITSDDREFLERQRRAVRLLRIGAALFAVVALLFLAWRLRAFWPVSAPIELPKPSAEMRTDTPPTAPPPAEAVPVVTTSAAPPPLEPATLEEAHPLVVEINVTANCWIFATADGVKVFSRLFKPGDSERLAAKREVFLDVGNAGALQWTINGRPGKSIGQAGVHARTSVSLDKIASLIE